MARKLELVSWPFTSSTFFRCPYLEVLFLLLLLVLHVSEVHKPLAHEVDAHVIGAVCHLVEGNHLLRIMLEFRFSEI